MDAKLPELLCGSVPAIGIMSVNKPYSRKSQFATQIENKGCLVAILTNPVIAEITELVTTPSCIHIFC